METAEALRLLDQEHQRLTGTRRVIDHDGDDTVPSRADGPDPADAARELVEREEHESMLRPVLRELADVRLAYARVLRGTYGRCEICGDVIPDERLRALPAARFCVHDERAAEGFATRVSAPDPGRRAAAAHPWSEPCC